MTVRRSSGSPPPRGAPEPTVPEYLPDALEVELRRPPPLARATLKVLAAMVAIAIAASAVTRVDRVVIAPGKLVTSAPTIVVQPLETSVVRSIDVKVGDRVAKGTQLGTFDPTFVAADVNQLRSEVEASGAHAARLEAEMDGGTYLPPASGGPEATLQGEIFQTRRGEYGAKLDGYDATITRLEKSIAARGDDISVLRDRREVIREVEDIRATLYRQQQGSKLQLLDAIDGRLRIEREIGVAEREVVEFGLDLARARAEREGYVGEWRRSTADELAEARRRLQAALSQLDKAERRGVMVAMTAPADAVVLDIAKRSVGSVVREAEPFFTLVPLDVPLEGEVEIEARDVGHVRIGAAVKLKLDAYPFQTHGMLEGEVSTVSADAFSREETAGRGGGAYYRARVALRTTTLTNTPPDFRLLPGSTVTAEIHAGHRTVLSYILNPLTRGLSEGLREP